MLRFQTLLSVISIAAIPALPLAVLSQRPASSDDSARTPARIEPHVEPDADFDPDRSVR